MNNDSQPYDNILDKRTQKQKESDFERNIKDLQNNNKANITRGESDKYRQMKLDRIEELKRDKAEFMMDFMKDESVRDLKEHEIAYADKRMADIDLQISILTAGL